VYEPAIFAEIIEDYFPNVPKIELNRSGKAEPGLVGTLGKQRLRTRTVQA
jgi:hypothetical protein